MKRASGAKMSALLKTQFVLDSQRLAKPKADQGQSRQSSPTYIAQVSDYLPDPRLVESRKSTSVLPKKMSKVAKFAQLGLDIKSFVLFPAVNVRKHIWMWRAWFTGRRIRIRKMLENLDLFAQP
jgi:hypothetical protein